MIEKLITILILVAIMVIVLFKELKNNKYPIWYYVIIISAMLILLSLNYGFTSQRYYQVTTRTQLGNCSTTRTFIIKAYSTSDIKEQALNISRLETKVELKSYKEVTP